MTDRYQPSSIHLRLAHHLEDAASGDGGYKALAARIQAANRNAAPASLDRRKLARIAKLAQDTSLTFAELSALDEYLRSVRRGGLAYLLHSQWLLESIAAGGPVTFFIGFKPGTFESAQHEQTLVSHWDVRSLGELQRGIYQYQQLDLTLDLEEVELRDHYKPAGDSAVSANWLAGIDALKPRSLIAIGSPKACHAAEAILARMFGIEGFGRDRPELLREKVPFRFEWNKETFDRRPSSFAYSSAQTVPAQLVDRGIDSFALEFNGQRLAVDLESDREWRDYAVVVAQRRETGHIWLVCAGLSGPATFAASQVAATLRDELPPLSSSRKPSKVVCYAIEATVKRIPRADHAGDDRQVFSPKVYGEPVHVA